ncbi:hypothetical protein TanjilG_20302 [Lupinus angustifolius]|uniref:Dof zinc finger protein n=1 Tax=Lupinus angustifolius TaxID=3871 RepID=A0A1J7G5C9_LUPAN|nr:PREDICTED: dof zinc finger protein DOF1.4-like [Lupinus angustifolius]OIV89529.1 hypothetical protein TanjilG_20302 [Lupinus angustifolius]
MNQHQLSLDQKLNETHQCCRGQQSKVQPERPQQPLQCPRCNSMNTKFCYYNNYNVAQPRHYCKTCRRYWTEGGTLRNIPIGGRCHKKKYAENSSSSRSQKPHSSQQNVVVQTHQPNLTTMMKARDPCLLMDPSTRPFYQGGCGYLSSLPTIHSMNQSHSTRYDQSFNVGGDLSGSTTNIGMESGFNVGSLSSQRHIYQMGGREREEHMPQQGLTIPSSIATIHNSVPSHTDWPWSFINNDDNRNYDASLWSNIGNNIITSINGNIDTNANVVGSSPLMQNQWSNFPGYGLPPSSY